MDLTRTYAEGDTLKDLNGHDFKLFGLDYTELVYVAARGKTFTMGDNNSGNEDEDETQITFDHDYLIGRFAVTQELYHYVMGQNPSEFIGKHRPVDAVLWGAITHEFLPNLNKKLRKTYPNLQGRFALPSEDQWEYAAAGGQVWNSPKLEYAGSNNLHDVGWFRDNSDKKSTFPVGLKEPNALGLYDMSGNVWEWCQDDYKANLAELPKSGLPAPNQKGNSKVLRGGSYFNDRINCRVRYRISRSPVNRIINYGFRLAFSSLQTETNL
ncbi:SUMF1/EgtB/PvdO family nonheme iron enzyme [Runella sp. SP2]|uniref:formylglycine-generating enzyme family protein n=1 Tax=Runella sp. SP2 TaxID=2268026 RepID=UPI000F07D351|nr:SUMF1/EgtB/PvdO family nonheme iron enzyme [Runella sp. SP2]AYQ33153.1 formylglycine-generating enzyme family protein [Runella sp. SP2]